jgi:hypothetical protein
MTLKIDRQAFEDRLVLRLIGNMRVEHIEEVRSELRRSARIVLDIGELALVSVEGVRFLNACQDDGIVIANGSPYISDWMLLERKSGVSRG